MDLPVSGGPGSLPPAFTSDLPTIPGTPEYYAQINLKKYGVPLAIAVGVKYLGGTSWIVAVGIAAAYFFIVKD